MHIILGPPTGMGPMFLQFPLIILIGFFYQSSNSISLLPPEPKIIHGRESELLDMLHLFNNGIPRIAILGAGGMGKTFLARAFLQHPDITARYAQNKFFVACSSATTTLELTNLIGGHLGLKPGKDLTQTVLWHFSDIPSSHLILDELEAMWEPVKVSWRY
jgi:Cdc6-like AAA superfamily ATPase